MLLTALTTLPAPASPHLTTLAANVSSSGRFRSKASSEPPTMTAKVPLRAPYTPPDTGASRKSIPRSWPSTASRRLKDGELVLRSMTVVPAGIVPKRPSSPETTSSTSRGIGRDKNTASAPSAAFAAEVALSAPSSAIRSSDWLFRSKACRSCSAVSRWVAIGPPILPTPINPIRMIVPLADNDQVLMIFYPTNKRALNGNHSRTSNVRCNSPMR